MNIKRGYRFKLKPSEQDLARLRLFSGHRRFVYNHFLTYNLYRLNHGWKILWYSEMEKWLSDYLLKSEEYGWLREAPKAVLQQALRDLDRAFRDAFDKNQPNKRIPTRKKKTRSQTFRFPQIRKKQQDGGYSFNLRVQNRQVWLPQIGWVGFHKSRNIRGEIKSVTVLKNADGWCVSIQTEYVVERPTHSSRTAVGCDRGVNIPFAFSDGSKATALRAFAKHEDKLARLQRRASKQKKFSNNWKKTQAKVGRVHHKIASVRKDYLHKLSTNISKNHAMVYLEELQISNMTRSASGDLKKPGKRVSQKRGLNKSILDVGWGMFAQFLEYKESWCGGRVAYVPAPGTSQECPKCAHKHADNRHTQARFSCAQCGFQGNADWVASLNIETRG